MLLGLIHNRYDKHASDPFINDLVVKMLPVKTPNNAI